jgi:hypothetical protein
MKKGGDKPRKHFFLAESHEQHISKALGNRPGYRHLPAQPNGIADLQNAPAQKIPKHQQG